VVDLELEPDQLELRQVAAGTLDRYAPISLARRYLDSQGDPGELWEQIAELGWLGVGLEDDDPFGVPGLCLLAQQVGRRAAPTTLVDTALIARVATACNRDWTERIVAGDPPLALAMLEPSGSWALAPLATACSHEGDHVVVSGAKTGVHHAEKVGLLAVVVELDGAPAVALVEPTQAGVEILPLHGLDPSCAPCRVQLDEVRVSPSMLLAGPAVDSALSQAVDVAAVATTAEGLGAATASLEMAVAYALEREQFGRKIGSFQALRHLLAEQHVLCETAWACVLYAAAALEERTDDAAAAVAVAKAHGAASTKAVVEGALQVFGGIGFTREHDLHLLYRRALECSGRFGGAEAHERRIADQLPSPAPARAQR
jgi:alkylation response protein AidB-like acyl-CoA dehydrogenase